MCWNLIISDATGLQAKVSHLCFYWKKISSQPSEGTKNQPDALKNSELIAF